MSEALDQVGRLAALPTATAALGIVFLGALVQGSLGFGMGLVSIPLLAELVPDRLPQSMVLASLPLVVLMLWHERADVRPRLVTWLLVGRILGVLPAVAVLAVVRVSTLQIIFAVATLAAVGLMAADRLSVRISGRSQFAVGSISGFVGTAAGFGGPPVALLYARETGRTLRATLAMVMLVGGVSAVVGYWATGRLGPADLAAAGGWLIPALLGFGVGVRLRRYLRGPRLRQAVLILVSAAALLLLVEAVTT